MPDGQADDRVNTNHSDLVKVLGTVISIIQSFLNENMEAKIFFTGSTQQRTDLYITILRRNYVELTKEFIISTLVGKEGEKRKSSLNQILKQIISVSLSRKKGKFEHGFNKKKYSKLQIC